MQPDDSYKKLQKKLLSLNSINDRMGEITRIRRQLEKQFMAAWKLGPDRRNLGSRVAEAIRHFSRNDKKWNRGFDHCTCYTGENDQRIVVTQPYDASALEITQYLTLDNGVCPEVIDATEWGFHYPGRAKLFLVKLPFGFREAMENFKENSRRMEIQEALQKQWGNAELESEGLNDHNMA